MQSRKQHHFAVDLLATVCKQTGFIQLVRACVYRQTKREKKHTPIVDCGHCE